MYKIKEWKFQVIENKQDTLNMIKLIHQVKPEIIAIDTEGTGLHIINDTPFLFQFGFFKPDLSVGYVYIVRDELIPDLASIVYKLSKKCKLVGHNLSFDLHMLANLGVYYDANNTYDTTFMIRLAHDALTVSNGGPPLGLKEYTTRYIDPNARLHDKKLQEERTAIASTYNGKLKDALKHKDKSWTLKRFHKLFEDYLVTVDDLDEDIQLVYSEWYDKLPQRIKDNMTTPLVLSEEVPYDILNRENLERYAYYDIVFTCEVYLVTKEAIIAREQNVALELERDLVLPIFRMERVGFQANKDYIFHVYKDMKNYIKERRERFYQLAGQELTVGQSKVILDILNDKWNANINATNAEVLDKLKSTTSNPELKEFIEILQELRTLAKWYQTYLMRFVRQIQVSDRIYTTIFSAGTVTGRVTSDFQQFPRGGIKKYDGTPLFNPRNMVAKSPNMHGIAYIDYSQIELRLQAMYTILVGDPDLNLCRAYMPYRCWSGVPGVKKIMFDYRNPEHIKNAYTWQWYREEDDHPWIPTDVHSATTKEAFPEIEEGTPEFKQARSIGKTLNFAKNYGAQFAKVKTMFPQYDDEKIKQIDEAYYKAFPGVKTYHNYCYNLPFTLGYGMNLFGGRYYGISGHKLLNALIQGSGAYLLKRKIIELDKYILDNRLKSRIQMNIHDEISFEMSEDELHHIPEFKKIMETVEGTLVPIVAEVEYTQTTWAEAKEMQ